MTNSNIHSIRASFKRGLRGKFLVILVVGAAFTTLCSALFGYYHGKKLRYDGIGTSMQKSAEKVSGQIDASLEAAVDLMTQLAKSTDLHLALTKKAEDEDASTVRYFQTNRVLEEFASSNPAFKALKVIDRDDKDRGDFGQLVMPYQGPHKWLDSAGRHTRSRAAISEPIILRKPASVFVQISVPILPKKRGGFSGELYAQYSLDAITGPLSQDTQEISAFLLTSAEGRRLYILGPHKLASSQPVPFQERGEKISTRSNSGHLIVGLSKPAMDIMAGYASVGHSFAASSIMYESGKGWLVLAATRKSDMMEAVNVLFSQAIGFGGLVLIIVSLIGLAFAQRILRPIRVLQEGVQEMGQGNLEHRIDVRSDDEIELLASEFNRMAERMQRTQEQLQRRGKELGERVNQLRRLQAQLMQSERMAATGELAAQIAHEINNPLGIIKNYVGIAKMLMVEEDPNRENLKIVDQEINRIAGIVRRLLKFAKPGTEDIQSVQINQVLEELLALLRGQLFRRKIEVSLDLSENLPEVSVSTDQMRQVFLNLVKNAEDAMSDGGNLAIRTRFRKGHVEIEIADSGCGIPAEDVKNIFEPFFTTKGVKGTGLGLSVSFGIVKNYNGEINVDSEPGVGTTFTVQLPVISDSVFQVVKSSS